MTTPIPEKHVQFCRDVIHLAVASKLTKVTLTFEPAWNDAWRSPIVLHWEAGRHGEDNGRLYATSTVTVRETIKL